MASRLRVVDRGEVASGTTGRNHGLLHSGARYAVKDPKSAAECIVERDILARIAPEVLELNGGLFVAVDDAGLAYREPFLEACARAGIPTRPLTASEVRALEPALSGEVLAAVEVPDGVFDPWHLCLAFLATARANGATIRPFVEVEELVTSGGAVVGAVARDRRTGNRVRLEADVVVNATGPWAGELAAMAGVDVPVVPTAGVMVAVGGRFVDRVVNRLDQPSDGDIVLPQRQSVIIGTSSWAVDDPDRVTIPRDHVSLMFERGGQLVPAVRDRAARAVFAASRPLIGQSWRRLRRPRPVPDLRMLRPRSGRRRGVRHDQRREDDDRPGHGRGDVRRRLREARRHCSVSDPRGSAPLVSAVLRCLTDSDCGCGGRPGRVGAGSGTSRSRYPWSGRPTRSST